jgi:hypothetical protein
VLRVRELRVIVVLTLAVAVAFILITPDSTDDVDAILHVVKTVPSHAFVYVFALDVMPIMRVTGILYRDTATNVTTHVSELLCTYRC